MDIETVMEPVIEIEVENDDIYINPSTDNDQLVVEIENNNFDRREINSCPVSYEILENGSRRGGRLLVSGDGYSYTVKRFNEHYTYWVCSVRSKALRCSAWVKQLDDIFIACPHGHQHPSNPEMPVKRKISAKAKDIADHDPKTSATRIIEDLITREGVNEIQNVPKASLIRATNRYRQQKRGYKLKTNTNSKMNIVKSPLTTHVLDTALGIPAKNVPIQLHIQDSSQEWRKIFEGKTNEDGRCPGMIQDRVMPQSVYKLTFDTGSYFQENGVKGFYPYVDVVFEISDAKNHHHVPLLLSPFGYSTYRGS